MPMASPYRDIAGHELSYTQFEYSDIHISTAEIGAEESHTDQLCSKECGNCAGDEVVQLYLRDRFASVLPERACRI